MSLESSWLSSRCSKAARKLLESCFCKCEGIGFRKRSLKMVLSVRETLWYASIVNRTVRSERSWVAEGLEMRWAKIPLLWATLPHDTIRECSLHGSLPPLYAVAISTDGRSRRPQYYLTMKMRWDLYCKTRFVHGKVRSLDRYLNHSFDHVHCPCPATLVLLRRSLPSRRVPPIDNGVSVKVSDSAA